MCIRDRLTTMLKGDWGDMGYNGTYGMDNSGGSWGGSWVIDSSKGLLFSASDDVSPYYSLGHRPGPNLWGASIFGINETTGQYVWGFQEASHDSWDRDCSWGVTYAPNTQILGQTRDVILKGCKSGYVFAIDANTGKPFWYFWPPNVGINQWDRLYDIRNATQMKLPWPNYPSNSSIIWHCGAGGCLEADIAYDPAANVVYVPTYQAPSTNKPDPCAFSFPCAADSGVLGGGGTPAGVNNATIYAVDVANGKLLWGYFIPNQSYRGGLTVSGGVVYVTTSDGFLRLLDGKTGALISSLAEGGPLRQQPAIGADNNGVMKVFLNDGAPGAIVALSLQPGAAQVVTSSTTLTQTITQGGVTITTTSVSTAVSTITAPAGGGGGAATTVTVTGANGATNGIDPTTFYVVAGVAALLAVTTALFAARGRRRPA